jgi:HEAT repeat protein
MNFVKPTQTAIRVRTAATLRARHAVRRLKLAVILLGALIVFAVIQPGTLRAAWARIASIMGMDNNQPPVTLNDLPPDFTPKIDSLAAQQQAEFLMQQSIDHSPAAALLVPRYSKAWLGKVSLTPELTGTLGTALNANDLRVRAAAIEVYLAANKVPKTASSAQHLSRVIDTNPAGRPWALWMLGALGNRGIEPEKALGKLSNYIHDSDEQTRFWTVEGLAQLGTDGTVAPLLDAFRNDPSPNVRERAASSIAHTGMLDRRQRLSAVPSLIEMAQDPALSSSAKNWVYQALADITNERLGHDPTVWREWWFAHQQR